MLVGWRWTAGWCVDTGGFQQETRVHETETERYRDTSTSSDRLLYVSSSCINTYYLILLGITRYY